MKKRMTLLTVTLMMIACLTACGESEESIKETIGKMDTVKVDTIAKGNEDKLDEILKDQESEKKDEDAKDEDKTEEKKDEDKTEDKSENKSEDKKPESNKTDSDKKPSTSTDTKKPSTSDDKKPSAPSKQPSTSNDKKPSQPTTNNNTAKPEAPKGCSHNWKANYKTVTTKAAWDETVTVKAAWSEQVLVRDAWSEQVCVREAQTITTSYSLCSCGHAMYSDAEVQAHTIWKLQNPDAAAACAGGRDCKTKTETIPAEYTTVNHPAETNQELVNHTCTKCGAVK